MASRFLPAGIALIVLALTASSWSAPPDGPSPGAPEAGGMFGRLYNPKTVGTYTGEVTRIDRTAGRVPGRHFMSIVLRTDKETITVHLGPAQFVEKHDMQLAVGDTVEVTGSRVTIKGKPEVLAREMRKGERVLKLRDESGALF